MSSSEKIAIAAHLHVLLRRKTGRVTDIEWMAVNRDYALEIARFSRQKAAEDGHADLSVWADKLEEIMATPQPRPRVPLVKRVADAVKEYTALTVPAPQGGQSIDTEEARYPESGFIESTFGAFQDSETQRERRPRDDAPRYVNGLR